jgi:hypothetical protein
MVDVWFPHQLSDHDINDASSSESGQSVRSNDHGGLFPMLVWRHTKV